MSSPASNEYLTTSQAAKLCHVSRFTILNWVKDGKIKAAATLGGHKRIAKQAIMKFIQRDRSACSVRVNAADTDHKK